MRKERVAKIHQRALNVVASLKRNEAELVEILQEMDREKGYELYQKTSLYSYAVEVLGLTPDVALNCINVARKAVKVPALQEAIQKGEVTVSKVRKITPVITQENHEKWLELVKTASSRAIEKAVAIEKPETSVPERAIYRAENLIEIRGGVSEKVHQILERVKDLLSQAERKAVDLNKVLEVLGEEYLERHDPIRKAQRAAARKMKPSTPVRDEIKHQGAALREDVGLKPAKRDWVNAKLDSEFAGAHARSNAKSSAPGHVDLELPEAERQWLKGYGFRKPRNKTYIHSAVVHAVDMRDQRQCVHTDSNGKRCENRRWLDLHHLIPKSQGGLDTVENLVTLCSAHHRLVHREGICGQRRLWPYQS